MLYNKWRPAVFADVRGQTHITKTLLAQLTTGRLAHAYLFTGSRGTGKTSCAKILARAVNCEAPDGGEPCNRCPSCLGILQGSVPDVSEIDAASNSGVDNIRSLREELVYSPVSSRKRVYIIDEVHMLSSGAFNALLKTLEEPPPHVLFILATTETHKVPATIVSRCQRFAFRRISKDEITENIGHICEKEDISIDTDALELIAQVADGSLRDAQSLLDQCSANADGRLTEASVRQTLGLTGLEELALWLREMDDPLKSLGHLELLYQAGMDVSAILGQLSALLRDLLMGQMLGDLSVTRLPPGEAKALSERWPKERILWALERFAETRLSRSGDKKLEAEICLLRLSGVRAEKEDKSEGKPPKKTAVKPAEKAVAAGEEKTEAAGKPAKANRPAMLADASADARWGKLLEAAADNLLLKEALTGAGAKVDGDGLVLQTEDKFIQGVIKQAEKQIKIFFSGGVTFDENNTPGSTALETLIASAGDFVVIE